jgi:hypothetical protein
MLIVPLSHSGSGTGVSSKPARARRIYIGRRLCLRESLLDVRVTLLLNFNDRRHEMLETSDVATVASYANTAAVQPIAHVVLACQAWTLPDALLLE